MKLRALSLAAALLLCAACGGKSGDAPTASPQPSVTLLIASRGVTMSLEAAVKATRFSPFIPSAEIVGVAAIPPLSSEDSKRLPGIAIEYESAGDALLLSQWPLAGFDIAVGVADATSRPCAPVPYKAGGLIWTTRDGRVMTLQADGAVASSRLAREAARVLRAGACGREIRTRSRPASLPSRRSRAVSSPRRSAS